ncbi:potassium channel family protein [Isoptericola dokdonensis]|jgi:voltage-gated potassium channel|uniref:pH-gated potassium channel KcsA n=1 Tax=Isoptericola dokdonensis DS-3 TaxID=1300344 RepID=A0A161IL92_9MICO|nr:potassium channel family protein [Isoptericola dokdonensis]ANC31230.1 pH-gated potassium channel KcsA [Isoptericola dokdonensis DS-3]
MSSEPSLPLSLARRRAEVVGPRLRRWEDATERPLAVVGVLFLVAYAIPIAFPDVDRTVRVACLAFLGFTWVLFAVDYVVRVSLARRRWLYVRRHPLALAVVLVPVLRPLLLISVVGRLNQRGRRRLRGKVVRYAAVGTTLLVITASLVVTQAERWRPDATIKTLGDGVWWAMVTVTTVGYGDMAPVSTIGRAMAVLLMLGGIALLGVVTATLSSWLVEIVTAGPWDDDEVADELDADAVTSGGDDQGGEVRTGAAPGRFIDAGPGSMVAPEQVALLTAELRALRSEIADLRRRLPDEPA